MAESNSKPTQKQHANCELKNCPFCGGEAEFVSEYVAALSDSTHKDTAVFCYLIACSKCKCTPAMNSRKAYATLNRKTGNVEFIEESAAEKQKMIDAWNTRTQDIVQCKDCRYSNDDGTICRYGVGRATEPEHYCGYGKRRGE